MAMAPDPNTSYDHDENYSCPICFDILQEPYLTECCGQHFCADCIAKVKQRVDRCPYCQTEPLIGITNKNFKRHLRKMYGDAANSPGGSNEQQTSKSLKQQQDVPNSPETTRQESGETTRQESGETTRQESGETTRQESGETTRQESGETMRQESSGEQTQQPTCNTLQRQDPSDWQIIAMQERDAKERRVDNVVQMTTTVSGTGLGGVGATLGGVAVGAAIGSVVPGIGTLIGGTIGGIAGGVSGVAGGSLIGFGVGKLTNRFRRNPMVKNALNRIPFPSRIRN